MSASEAEGCGFDPRHAHHSLDKFTPQVERRRLYRLLLLAGQAGEAGGEGVGDAEVHWKDGRLFLSNQSCQPISQFTETWRNIPVERQPRANLLSPFVFELSRQWPT